MVCAQKVNGNGKVKTEDTKQFVKGNVAQLLGIRGGDKEKNIWKIRLQLTKPVTWIPLIWGEHSPHLVSLSAILTHAATSCPFRVKRPLAFVSQASLCMTGHCIVSKLCKDCRLATAIYHMTGVWHDASWQHKPLT